MSISSLIIHALPDRREAVGAALAAIEGVEVHAATEDGRMIVTVDRLDDNEASEVLMQFQTMEGVLNAALVYSYFDKESGVEEKTR